MCYVRVCVYARVFVCFCVSGVSLDQFAQVSPSVVLSKLPERHPWLLTTPLVVKPDQLIKRRGKSGLILLNATWPQVVEWVEAKRGVEVRVEKVSGVLDHFLIEPFYPHAQQDEVYVCIHNKRAGDELLFYHQGGVDVGDVDAKAIHHLVPLGAELSEADILHSLLQQVPQAKQAALARFLCVLYRFYVLLHYSYLEINPLVVTDDLRVLPLDLAAKIDETAKFECGNYWGRLDFPPPFGRPLLPAEQFIAELDGKTGASVKLTILNPTGRVWTMVAGGGASVIYADTLCDMGAGEELANYGEYSGAPDEQLTFEYARTILELMTKERHPKGKLLLIGGGIANFTNVAATFKGIIRALTRFADVLLQHNVRIFVRRAGPNYQEGLEMMRSLAAKLDLHIEVFGPETHMTMIVPLALGLPVKQSQPQGVPATVQDNKPSLLTRTHSSAQQQQQPPASPQAPSRPPPLSDASSSTTTNGAHSGAADLSADGSSPTDGPKAAPASAAAGSTKDKEADYSSLIPKSPPVLPSYQLFTNRTRALIYGMQPGAVQNMLDFDFICGRQFPSVAGVVYPFSGNHYMKFYWQTKEILLPIYQSLSDAVSRFPDVDVVVNFSSFRSVFESTMDVLSHRQIRTVAIIAEGVPERQTRLLIQEARTKGVTIIGPATVGGIKPGCFRIGNTGGMLDNIIASRLYRPGSVAYVARSGGMSNELNNIIALNSDGVYEGVAIGGDKYPGTTFIDHLLRFQDNPDVKGTQTPHISTHTTTTPHSSARTGKHLTFVWLPLLYLLLCDSRLSLRDCTHQRYSLHPSAPAHALATRACASLPAFGRATALHPLHRRVTAASRLAQLAAVDRCLLRVVCCVLCVWLVVCVGDGGVGRGGWCGRVRDLSSDRGGSSEQAHRGLVHRHVRQDLPLRGAVRPCGCVCDGQPGDGRCQERSAQGGRRVGAGIVRGLRPRHQ